MVKISCVLVIPANAGIHGSSSLPVLAHWSLEDDGGYLCNKSVALYIHFAYQASFSKLETGEYPMGDEDLVALLLVQEKDYISVACLLMLHPNLDLEQSAVIIYYLSEFTACSHKASLTSI